MVQSKEFSLSSKYEVPQFTKGSPYLSVHWLQGTVEMTDHSRLPKKGGSIFIRKALRSESTQVDSFFSQKSGDVYEHTLILLLQDINERHAY